MKRFYLLIALLLVNCACLTSLNQAHAAPQYSNVWRPITDMGIRDGIQRNRKNGVGLEQTMKRALLQQKGAQYLAAIKAASDAEPKNGILLAAYVWALVEVKNSYRFNSPSSPVPANVSQRFNFGDQYILNTLQKSKELNKRNWLAYMVQSAMEPGGLLGQPSKSLVSSKRAFTIQRNALTLTKYGSDLMFQSSLLYGSNREESRRQAKEGLRLLLMAQRLYPTYYKVPYELYLAYQQPLIADKNKSLRSLQRFYLNVPPEYRHSPWVVRYFKYLGLDEPLMQIGVTL